MKKEIIADKQFKYYTGDIWKYYTNRNMHKLFPDGSYKIIGEVSKKKGKVDDVPYVDQRGKTLYIQPLFTHRKWFYRSSGYLPVFDGNFVIVKKSNLLCMICSLIVSIALILGIIFGVNYLLNQPTLLDPNAKDYVADLKRPDNWDATKILIPGYDDWNMKAGTNEVFVALFNPNDNPCYFQFEVLLEDTHESLFKTGLVPPGKAVTRIELPRKFKAGIYNIIVRVKSFSLEDSEIPLNGGEVKTRIVAINSD